jgi:hypothetical protein
MRRRPVIAEALKKRTMSRPYREPDEGSVVPNLKQE